MQKFNIGDIVQLTKVTKDGFEELTGKIVCIQYDNLYKVDLGIEIKGSRYLVVKGEDIKLYTNEIQDDEIREIKNGDVFCSSDGEFYIHTSRYIGNYLNRFFLKLSSGDLLGCGTSNNDAYIYAFKVLELHFCPNSKIKVY